MIFSKDGKISSKSEIIFEMRSVSDGPQSSNNCILYMSIIFVLQDLKVKSKEIPQHIPLIGTLYTCDRIRRPT